jgi:ribosomal protein S18 acetylase RimI-like enzyme
MKLTIRNLTEADLDPINSVLMAAFGRPSSFKSELQRYLRLQPDGWLIAERDGSPVGMVGALDYGGVAYIGLMGVHPAAQRQGIGQALLERLLAWLDSRSCPMALLDATEVGTLLYAKFGFVEDEKSLVFKQNSVGRSLGSLEGVSVLRPTELEALCAFDTPIFGAKRQKVFAAFLQEIPDRAFIIRNEADQISGYLFAQARNLGPWAAKTPEVAETLLAAALSLPFEDTPQVIVPGSNPLAKELLMRYGFKEQRVLSHMRRGGSTSPGYRAMLYGMATFAIG